MKFSPVLPFALSSLITTSLAAPTNLRQPGPASVGRRSSEVAAEDLAAVRAPVEKRVDNLNLADYSFGMGDELEAVKKEKRSDGDLDLEDYSFGMGNELEKEKRQDNIDLSDYHFGMGDELELVKKAKTKRADGNLDLEDYSFGMGNEIEKEKRSDDNIDLSDYHFGMGDELELVKKEKRSNSNLDLEDYSFGMGEPLLAARNDPIIRRKAAELRALIKARTTAPSTDDVLTRSAAPEPEAAAAAA